MAFVVSDITSKLVITLTANACVDILTRLVVIDSSEKLHITPVQKNVL